MKHWWEDAHLLDLLGLREIAYDDPKHGRWIECKKCTSGIWCLERERDKNDDYEPPRPEFSDLKCDNGCNSQQIKNPPGDVLGAMALESSE